jgi:hypothetical protein
LADRSDFMGDLHLSLEFRKGCPRDDYEA